MIVASEALWQLGLDEVLLVPAADPPHKPAGAWAPAERRVAWLQAAVAGTPGLVVSRIELERDGPSYTADTLETIAAAEPDARLWFVMGADQLPELPRWRDPDRVLAAARLAVVPRERRGPHELRDVAERVAPGSIDWLDVPTIGISSTMIRDRIERGRPIRHLVPVEVEQALREEGVVPSSPDA